MATQNMSALGLGVAFTLGVAGCSERPPAAGAFVSRDSAGIQIMESARPALPASSWQIGERPVLSIGQADGDSTQELYRVTAALRLAPDTLVVVNGGTAEVRWYDGRGHLIRSVGRQGEGPGEFGELGPGSACITGDGDLLVGDPIQKRANVFTRSGEFRRVVQLTGDAAVPSIQGCFADGTLLGWRSVSPTQRVPGTIIQAEVTWSRVDPDGTRVTDLAARPSAPQYLLEQNDGIATYHTIPFTARPSAAAADSAVYVAQGDAPVIKKYNLDGTADAYIRWEPATRVKSADVYDRYRESVLESQNTPERRSYWNRFFSLGVEVPDQVATIQSIMVDAGGNLWAERYVLPWDTIGIWDVFDAEGRWIVEVSMPSGFRPRHIGTDFVTGLTRDDVGVERIEVRLLERPSS